VRPADPSAAGDIAAGGILLAVRALRAHAKEAASAGIVAAAVAASIARALPVRQDGVIQGAGEPMRSRVVVDSTAPPVERLTTAAQALFGQGHTDAPWDGWVWLEGARLKAEADQDAVRVVAARIPHGIAVAVYNTSTAPADLRIAARLGPARYTVDRLVFEPAEVSAPDRLPNVERLQSVLIEAVGMAEKPGRLPPGAGAVYRFVNQASVASEAYRRAMRSISQVSGAAASQRRKLTTALRECPWLLTQVQTLLNEKDPEPALKALHRALLTVRHAMALCTNAAGLGRMGKSRAAAISGDLADLEAALTECSVASLNLVPSAREQVDPDYPHGRSKVVVAVHNAGALTVRAVRLWATGTSGRVVEPGDAAVFDALGPGQAASATFRVMGPAEDASESGSGTGAAASEAIVGHLAYFRASAPAHLRFVCQ